VKRIFCAIFAGTFVLLMAGDILAQGTAQINGTVRDQTGAVLPGVEVTVTQNDTGITRSAITNETGSYVLSNLPIGPYRLEASLPGFRTYARSGIVLQVNSSPLVNPVLEVGQVTEQVEVQANATLVETRTAGVGQVVENARILELPLNGRQVTELIALAGAATPATEGVNSRNPFATTVISVAGGLSSGLNYALDGANHNNPIFNTYFSIPFPDALQEFKVETSATSAQSGVKSAGSVTLVTKSGTNELHGDLFEFVRNGMFNARNSFATKRDSIKRNQFGGTIGGPIVKNKLFFFGGYQGTIIRQDPADIQSFVPTSALLAGDFTAFASPICNAGRQIGLRAPFVNNRVDPALFSKPAVLLASKLPSTADPCGKIIYGNANRENDRMAVAKFDYQRSAQNSMFARYILDTNHNPTPYKLTHNLLSTTTLGSEGLSQMLTLGETYLFGANIVNSIRLSHNRFSAEKTDGKFFSFPSLGVKTFSYEDDKLLLSVTGGFSLGTAGGPSKTTLYAIDDDLSVLRGNHQFAVGAHGAAYWVTWHGNNYNSGNASFNGQVTGLGMADFLLGNVFQYSLGTIADQSKRSQYIGLYGADTWKLNQKLTLNYGLRWEPYIPITNLDRSLTGFDLDALRKGIKSTQFKNAPPGLFFPGDAGFPGLKGQYNQWMNFSPRVGLAWDVSGDGRTSVRTSAGTFYDYPSAYYQVGMSYSPPWNPRILVNNVRFEDPWAGYPGGNPFPIEHGKNISRDVQFPLFAVVTPVEYHTPNMRVFQWNLSVQKQIGTDWLASATYLGSNTIHLWSMQQINPAVYLPGASCILNGVTYNPCSNTGNTDQRRRLMLENPQTGQYFSYVVKLDPGGTASYNGLLLSIQRRAARGVTVNANYTLSHCISDWWNTTANSGSGNTGFTNPDNRRFDRGNCTSSATDRRHIFNLSAVAESPRFNNSILRVVGSNWRVSPIFKILSGSFMSITTSSDVALNGISGQRVNQMLASPYGAKTVKNYLNPAAFALPATGSLGNLGASNIAGPGTWQFDMAVSRSFQIREKQRVEFRAEAFNVTNAFRMNNPTTNLNSNTFGQITTTQDPRIMQFALKYFY